MIHLPILIQDLCFILVTAAVVTVICKKLKQPVVLGYLVAGFLVGPHFPFIPTVEDTSNIQIWAEIGVIFLLFSLGLEFSFKKLTQVGKSAGITAVFEIVFMMAVGYLTGQIMGWSKMDSLFLGGILSISSTTIIVRAFEELNLKGKSFVSLVFGVLVIEDLIAILLLVLLSSVAVTQSFLGSELMTSVMKLGFFLLLWFILGIYLIPIVLKMIKKYLSDETMLLVSIGLCLLMVMVATHVGFSPALGAFVMGSLLAETTEGHRIEHLLLPVKNLFAAVFFVSVGMLIDVNVLGEFWGVILILTVITIFGKLISSALGALISGTSLKNSVRAGMSLAQIGEFSFIIATLGLTLKVTSDFLYPIAVAVSAVTTFTTPYQIKYADLLYQKLEAMLPARMKDRLRRYENAMSTPSDVGVISVLWSAYGLKILINLVVVIAMVLGIKKWAYPFLLDTFQYRPATLAAILLSLAVVAPFLWAIVVSPPTHKDEYPASVLDRLQKMQFGISLFRFIFGIFLVLFILGSYTVSVSLAVVVLAAIALVLLYFSRYSEPLYRAAEERFLRHLTENERQELEKKSNIPTLAPWDATLTQFTVSPNSSVVAKSLVDLGVKEKFGITVAMIERGSKKLLAPVGTELVLPYDKLYVIGQEEALDRFRQRLDQEDVERFDSDHHFGLRSLHMDAGNELIGKAVRNSGLRENLSGIIVGIERANQRILSPEPSFTIQEKDLLWIVCDLERLKKYLN